MKLPRKIASLLTITLVAGSGLGNLTAEASKYSSSETIIGKGRWETAVDISKKGWPTSNEAVIVNDSALADALTATPFAEAKDAPILLTQNNKLDDRTKAELKRLGVKKVYLIGGESALSKSVENTLKSENIQIDRIWGSTRYETSLEIAKRLDSIKDVSEIAVVNGDKGIADAISIAPVASDKDMPIILSHPGKGTQVSDGFIKGEDIKTSYIIGGTTAVSDELANKLPNVKRLEGQNRNETNAKVIETFYTENELKNAYVAKDGISKESELIDGLAIGVLAAKNDSPVILVRNKLNQKQKDVVNTKSFKTITQVGGGSNQNGFNELKSIQEVTTYNVGTIAELIEVIGNCDANDIINMNIATINEEIVIKTNKKISINLSGNYKNIITVSAPNASVVNKGTISKLVVKDSVGASIENASEGKISNLEIQETASNVDIVNKGTITNIKNDAKGTTINNIGSITNIPTGNQIPSLEGNRPGGSTSSGGGGGGGSSKPEIDKPKDQEAPSGLNGLPPTSIDGNDGKIEGLDPTKQYEYKKISETNIDNKYISNGAGKTEIAGLSAGTYEVRLAKKEGYNASKPSNVVVEAYKETNKPQESPSGLNGLSPTSIDGNDGKIEGLDPTKQYEYKKISETRIDNEYISVELGKIEITSLSAGTYAVRFAETVGYDASEPYNVVVESYKETPDEGKTDLDILKEQIENLLKKIRESIDSSSVDKVIIEIEKILKNGIQKDEIPSLIINIKKLILETSNIIINNDYLKNQLKEDLQVICNQLQHIFKTSEKLQSIIAKIEAEIAKLEQKIKDIIESKKVHIEELINKIELEINNSSKEINDSDEEMKTEVAKVKIALDNLYESIESGVSKGEIESAIVSVDEAIAKIDDSFSDSKQALKDIKSILEDSLEEYIKVENIIKELENIVDGINNIDTSSVKIFISSALVEVNKLPDGNLKNELVKILNDAKKVVDTYELVEETIKKISQTDNPLEIIEIIAGSGLISKDTIEEVKFLIGNLENKVDNLPESELKPVAQLGVTSLKLVVEIFEKGQNGADITTAEELIKFLLNSDSVDLDTLKQARSLLDTIGNLVDKMPEITDGG